MLGNLKRDREARGGPELQTELIVFARGFDEDLRRRAEREGARLVSAADLFRGG